MPSIVNRNQQSVCKPCSKNWPVGEQRAFGFYWLIANFPSPLLRRLSVFCYPCGLQHCALQDPLGLPITDAGCPTTAFTFPARVLTLASPLPPSAPLNCREWLFHFQGPNRHSSSHSSGFRLQRRWNSWPCSWIHLFATETYGNMFSFVNDRHKMHTYIVLLV